MTSRRRTSTNNECDLEGDLQKVVECDLEDKDKGDPGSFIVKV